MVNKYRYIQIDKTGKVNASCSRPVVIDGITITIDTEGMTVPEMPTDAIYALYYNETDKLHWVKVADLEEETTEKSQLDRIEEQLAFLTADSVTVTNVEAAILEGVNEV